MINTYISYTWEKRRKTVTVRSGLDFRLKYHLLLKAKEKLGMDQLWGGGQVNKNKIDVQKRAWSIQGFLMISFY